MNPPLSLQLTPEERRTLEAWSQDVADRRAAKKRALRATIVLAAADGLDPSAIADRLCVRPSTARKWSRRFVQERLAGLDDRARSGAPRRTTQERITDVVLRALEPTPHGARPWSRRMISRATGVSRSTVHRIWCALDIAPNRRSSHH